MTIEDFLSRLDGVKPYKSGWLARCPAHDDSKQSFSVRLKGTMIQVHCFAGCTKESIIAAVPGVESFADLFTDGGNGNGHSGSKRRDGKKADPRGGVEWVTEAEYDYTDEFGDLEFQVVRMKPANGAPDKKIFQRRPVPEHPGEWAMGLTRGWYTKGRDDRWRKDDQYKGGADQPPPTPGAIYLEDQRPLLYRMGDLMAGQHWQPWPSRGATEMVTGRWLVICEGEKKVDACLAVKIPATTCAQGAGKWRDGHADQLVTLGVKLVLLSADNDPPGFRHMVDVAKSCLRRGIAVRELDLPGLAPKADVHDYLHAMQECSECTVPPVS